MGVCMWTDIRSCLIPELSTMRPRISFVAYVVSPGIKIED